MKIFEIPELEIVRMEAMDVITTSGITTDEDETPLVPANI